MGEIQQELIDQKLIPLFKSWMIRMGCLDMVHGYDDIVKFVETTDLPLNYDIEATAKAAKQWLAGEQSIDVGESGTLARFAKYANWKFGLGKDFIYHGTLKTRKIFDYDELSTNDTIDYLLTLDGGTTQVASAAITYGHTGTTSNLAALMYLQVSVEARPHYHERRAAGKTWDIRFDPTLGAQCEDFLSRIRTGEGTLDPDTIDCDLYLYMRALEIMSREEGENKWPHMTNHESSRFVEMDKQLNNYYAGREITTKDHRVVSSIEELFELQKRGLIQIPKGKLPQKPVFTNYGCVGKAHPQHPQFMQYALKN